MEPMVDWPWLTQPPKRGLGARGGWPSSFHFSHSETSLGWAHTRATNTIFNSSYANHTHIYYSKIHKKETRNLLGICRKAVDVFQPVMEKQAHARAHTVQQCTCWNSGDRRDTATDRSQQ